MEPDIHPRIIFHNEKYSIELDFYYAGPRPTSTDEVEVELLKENGPGGGNPLYKLTGTHDDLSDFICDSKYTQLGKDDPELEFYLTPSN